MTDVITSELVVAYSHCPRKAYLLCKGEAGDPHAMDGIIERKVRANRERYPGAIGQSSDLVSTNVTLRSGDFEAHCDVLIKRGESSFEPTLVVGTHKVTKDEKISLAYIAHVIANLQNRKPSVGNIVREQNKIQKVRLEATYSTIKKILTALQPWVNGTSKEEPAVILNDHCPSCQFRHKCRAVAEQADSLTLLDRMTPKLISGQRPSHQTGSGPQDRRQGQRMDRSIASTWTVAVQFHPASADARSPGFDPPAHPVDQRKNIRN
jgi:predicted RecB family nuclease